MIVSSRKIHQKFANFLVAPSRPRNCGDQLPAPLFFISDFFRKVQKVRQFILGFKGEILILAKMELPFRFLEPPPPGRAKNPNFTRLETRSTKFPHYLFDFSLGLSPRTFLPIKKPLFFFTAASGKFTKKISTSKGKMAKKYEVPATVSPAAPPQRGSVQSGECWTAGNPGAAGR